MTSLWPPFRVSVKVDYSKKLNFLKSNLIDISSNSKIPANSFDQFMRFFVAKAESMQLKTTQFIFLKSFINKKKF